MTFREEWAQLKAEAKAGRAEQMQLNANGPGPGGANSGPGPHLRVHQDDLGKVGNEAFRLHGILQKTADVAGGGANKSGAGTTAQAAAELRSRNLSSGSELYTTLEMWTSQVKTVLQMCAHISNHLDYSVGQHAKDEALIEASMKQRNGRPVPVSELEKYVK
ncbi:hypothetical protein ACFYVL_27020 [Streptomyces sp. NPDC004111]|uniref:hypothetical protein n=1 Tax=Streptomyces sp. NPDC004111 TaxID=3364690 RepID=UPI003688CBF6